jgi:hypothetical protein
LVLGLEAGIEDPSTKHKPFYSGNEFTSRIKEEKIGSAGS